MLPNQEGDDTTASQVKQSRARIMCADNSSDSECNVPKDSDLLSRSGATTSHSEQTSSNDNDRHYKILLLGPGMSGKTTLFKQMKKLHGTQLTQNEIYMCYPFLIKNLIESFRKLCIYSDILAEQQQQQPLPPIDENADTENDTACPQSTRVSEENRAIRDYCAKLNDRSRFDAELYDKFKRLLEDKGIQQTLRQRYTFILNDNFDYLVSRMHLLCKRDYVVTFDDYLHVKQRTVGLQQLTFVLPSKTGLHREFYHVHDAGGQRSERRKWVHILEGADAFMFVAAISGYNQTLWEEVSYNRLREAVHLFRRVYHMDILRSAHVILFLNKYDLFEKKIAHFPFRQHFPEYQGNETAELVKEYIVNMFKKQMDVRYALPQNQHPAVERALYVHTTCATDTNCVNKVFELTRDIIVLKSLTAVGFL